MLERIRKFENLHIVLWLCKDISWCLEWKILGIIMIIPTIALAFFITYLTRKNKKEMFHNIAVSLWISANSLWMFGEFFEYDTFRVYAKYLFFAGIASIVWFYASSLFITAEPNLNERK